VQALDRVGDGNQFPYLFKDTFISLESTICLPFLYPILYLLHCNEGLITFS